MKMAIAIGRTEGQKRDLWFGKRQLATKAFFIYLTASHPFTLTLPSVFTISLSAYQWLIVMIVLGPNYVCPSVLRVHVISHESWQGFLPARLPKSSSIYMCLYVCKRYDCLCDEWRNKNLKKKKIATKARRRFLRRRVSRTQLALCTT